MRTPGFGQALVAAVMVLGALVLAPARALAQTDEIQVYTAAIADPGKFNLTWHNNYIAEGSKDIPFPGAFPADHSFNGVTEWAYGVAPWFEAGLYLPLYSVPKTGGVQINGFKLRTLFVEPDADKKMFAYGVNFEFSFNSEHWDPKRYTSEIRPILGWHLGKWDIIVNPILDNNWTGIQHLDFAPSTRLAYNFNDHWALAAEEYADMGEIYRFDALRDQKHQLFAVMDYTGMPVDVEAGVGFGLTQASDKLTLKLILSRDLN